MFDLLITFYEFDQDDHEDLQKMLETFKLDPEEMAPFLQKHGVKYVEVYVQCSMFLRICMPLFSFDSNHTILQDLQYLSDGELVSLNVVVRGKMKKMISSVKVKPIPIRLPMRF